MWLSFSAFFLCVFLFVDFFFIFWVDDGLVGQKGGCFIVDSTRKGKRFPDSMSKTIPIWTCVLNRAIRDFRKKLHAEDTLTNGVSSCNSLDE